MADSRILPTSRMALVEQPGQIDRSSFFRVNGDDKFYWMKLKDKNKASIANIAYYKSLKMDDASSSPITTCFKDKDTATEKYLKIGIVFLHEQFGQKLKDSYTCQEIVKQYKAKNKRKLSNPLAKEVCPSFQVEIPNKPRPSSNLSDGELEPIAEKKKLDKQDGTQQSVFSRVKGENEFYCMKLSRKNASNCKERFTDYFNSDSKSQMKVDTQKYLKISIDFLQKVFGRELKNSYSVKEISLQLKRQAERVIPNTQEPIKSIEELKEQGTGKNSVFVRVDGDNTFYWMRANKAGLCKRNFDKSFKIPKSPIGTFNNKYLKIPTVFLQKVFGPKLKNLYSVDEISVELKWLKLQNRKIRKLPENHATNEVPPTPDYENSLKTNDDKINTLARILPDITHEIKKNLSPEEGMLSPSANGLNRDLENMAGKESLGQLEKCLDDLPSSNLSDGELEPIAEKEKLAEQDGTLESVFSRIKGQNKFYYMKLPRNATACRRTFAWYSNSDLQSQMKVDTQEYLKIPTVFLQKVFGPKLKNSYSVKEISAELKWLKLQNGEIRKLPENHATNEVPPTPYYENILETNGDTMNILERILPDITHEIKENLSSEEGMLPLSQNPSENGSNGFCQDLENMAEKERLDQLEKYLDDLIQESGIEEMQNEAPLPHVIETQNTPVKIFSVGSDFFQTKKRGRAELIINSQDLTTHGQQIKRLK